MDGAALQRSKSLPQSSSQSFHSSPTCSPPLQPKGGHGGCRRALEDRVRAVQGRCLRQEAGGVRAAQGPPVPQVHGVRLLRLPRVPVGDPGPATRRGLRRPQHRQHGPTLRQDPVRRRRVRHRVRRLRAQGGGHRGHRPQPLRRDQGAPLAQGWRARQVPLRRGLGQDRRPREDEGAGRPRLSPLRRSMLRLGKGSRQRVPREPQDLPVRQGRAGEGDPQAGRRSLRLRLRQVRDMGSMSGQPS